MSNMILNFNGLDMKTGAYLYQSMTPEELKALAIGEKVNKSFWGELKDWWESRGPHYGLEHGHDYKKLSDAGWGVIFAGEPEPGVYEALKPLLDLRREQAGDRYKEYKNENGYLPGYDKPTFLKESGAAVSGAVDPEKMPYYLMIVGDPEAIPYEFQYQMDVAYGVGRIHFDRVEDYANYAASVVAAETGDVKRTPTAAFFGVANEGDAATQLSSKYLVDPLKKVLDEAKLENWNFKAFMGAEATKNRLASLLGGEDTPTLLFSASHGMGVREHGARQFKEQGALLCQDWPGPTYKGDLRSFYFAGEDLSANARLGGTIAMFFACYGAGTPKFNDFEELDKKVSGKAINQIAEKAFVAELPKQMLSRPGNNGALAVIGHVERAWGCSFQTTGTTATPQISTFKSSMQKLLEGYPVGFSTEDFNQRYAEVSSDLLSKMPKLKAGMKPTEAFLGLWTESYDARNYSLVGDPAVRLSI